MTRISALIPEFVEFMPATLVEGVIYISMPYATAAHKCCCGCGRKVVTPFSPTDWNLWFDGESVSLNPSIGNWSSPCQSHYFITRGNINWAQSWSKFKIEANRSRDRAAKENHFNPHVPSDNSSSKMESHSGLSSKKGVLTRLIDFFRR